MILRKGSTDFMSLNALIEKVYEKKKLYIDKKYIQRKLYWKKRLFKPFSDIVYVIGCPEFSNLGDNAIMIAEIEFLKKCGIPSKHIECITEKEFLKDYKIISGLIEKKSLICGHGGGNMGNQYVSEEKVRRTMLECFPNNKIIIFPQTIFFSGENKNADERDSIKYYNGRTNLTLIAREKESYKIMRNLYPDTDILLTPDIVLSAKMETYDVVPQKRNGVLFCLRNDLEKNLSAEDLIKLKGYVKKHGLKYHETDMYSDCDINNDNRKNCIKKKMQEFCGAELVITDRLHGMIFAAITDTPCIVLNNYNHKVEGVYQWIKYLPYVKFVNIIEETEKYIPELLKTRYCKFDNEPLSDFFDKILMLINR